MGVIAPKEGQEGSVISPPDSSAPITTSSGQEKNLVMSVSLRGPEGPPGPPGGVITVNGQNGNVVLGAGDVNADPAGSAISALASHLSAPDPHPQYLVLADTDTRYERGLVAGANISIDRSDPGAPVISATEAASSVTAHESAADPHPQYLTSTEANSSYAPANHVGSGGAAHVVATTTEAGFLSAADKTKLDGIVPGATANATDAQLRDRNLHTGTQTANTISDLSEAVQDIVGTAIIAGTNITVNYNDTTGQITISAAGSTAGTQRIPVACSDETTALTAGTAKVTFRMQAFTLSAVRASLTTAQASGSILTIDINVNGVSILSTKLTIDNTEKTSATAAVPAVISSASITEDAEITIDIDQVGDGTAKGLKVYLIGVPV